MHVVNDWVKENLTAGIAIPRNAVTLTSRRCRRSRDLACHCGYGYGGGGFHNPSRRRRRPRSCYYR